MQKREETRLRYSAKSEKGLLVKAEVNLMDGLEHLFAYWHPKLKVESQMMVAYGPGDVKFNQAPIGRPFPSGWVDCGSVLLDQPEVIGAVPLIKLNDLKRAIGKHVVHLIAQGWGDVPKDVLSWFDPFCPLKAFVQATYCIVEGLVSSNLLISGRG